MNFEFSEKVRALQAKLTRFMDEEIHPLEPDYHRHLIEAGEIFL